MTDQVEAALLDHAETLRDAFDRSFAVPTDVDRRETIDFIALRLGDDVHALRMSEIGGLFTDVKVTQCPSPVPELRGIAAFRGTLTPVYDLAQLLGYPRSSGEWMVLTADRPLAFAFGAFDGHFRVEPSALAVGEARHVKEVASSGGDVHPIIDVASVAEAVAARVTRIASSKE